MYYVIRTIRSGNVIERSEFYAGRNKPRAKRKEGSTTAERKDINTRGAIKELARLINCNFSRGDVLLTLDFDSEPETAAAASKEISLFWRRLTRYCKLAGTSLRGFWSLADKDAETGKPTRLHAHCVLNGDALEIAWKSGIMTRCTVRGKELCKIWGNGGIDIEPLRQQDDYTPLAAYIVRQAYCDTPDARKWCPTRNLARPVVEREEYIAVPRPLRAPGGAIVHEQTAYEAGSGLHYIRYTRPKKPGKVGGHKNTQPRGDDEPRGGGEV